MNCADRQHHARKVRMYLSTDACIYTRTELLIALGVFSMPEAGGSNIEIAHHLSEHRESQHVLGHEILEIAEAIVLAVVAIATAWSGYQAALWTGHEAELYGLASRLRVEAEGAATFANQERLYNASTVVEWLKAEAHGDKKLADLFERRFLPEFRPAFEAWKRRLTRSTTPMPRPALS